MSTHLTDHRRGFAPSVLCLFICTVFLVGCGGGPGAEEHSSGASISSQSSTVAEVTLQESDPATCQVDGLVESEHQGYTGAGYANLDNTPGAGMVWHLVAEQEGRYDLTLYYANGGLADRPARLQANNGIAQVLSFAPTADWSSWQSLRFTVDLDFGSNQITLAATTVEGLANIDKLTVLNGEIRGGNCALSQIASNGTSYYLGDAAEFKALEYSKGRDFIQGYDWDFGDGQSGSGKTLAHTYSAAGLFTVSLTLTDTQGNQFVTYKEIQVQDAPRSVTVYIAGDSTVSTYADTASTRDQAGWGQMLRQQFTHLVTVDNRAIGGRSARRFIDEGYLEAIWQDIQSGDYLLVQFGTNDGHKTATYTLNGVAIPYYLDPATDFKYYLQKYVDGAKSRGVNLVFVTPPPRNSAYCTGGNGTGAHAQAMRELAAATATPLVDLNSKTVNYLKAICPAPTPEDFFLLRADGSVDGTHFQENGARIMGRMVAEALTEAQVALSRYRIP